MNVLEFLEAPYSEIYYDKDHITIDLETTNIRKGNSLEEDNDIVLASYKVDTLPTESAWTGALEFPTSLIDSLEGECIIIGHNIKFDLRWLARAGLDLAKVMVWDTMVMEKLILGNNPANLPLDLGSVAGRYGYPTKEPVVDRFIKMGVCPSVIPKSLLQRRCEYDVNVAYELFLIQRDILDREGKLGVALTRNLLTPVLADMELQGLCLDAQRVHEEWELALNAYVQVSNKLSKLRDINWNSPLQKSEALYDKYRFKELKRYGKPLRTPSGGRKADIDTIKQLKATTKVQRTVKELLIEQSTLNAKLTKALDKFKACVDAEDLLYANFTQHITRTHRLSSTGDNYKTQLQNLARIFKRLFKARHDEWEFCEADGANLEFRVAVEIGNDEQGRRDISNPDFDAHTNTSNKLTEAGQPTNRQDAKQHTFKPLYGGSSGTDAERAYYDSFKERYQGIAAIQEEWKDEALKTKSVRLPWGMEFFFPNTRYTHTGYQVDSTQICNYPVQSFATADIIPIAIVYTWHRMKAAKLAALLVNSVHDSVEIEAPVEEKEKINEILVQSFTISCYTYIKDVYNMDFRTPLGVGIKWGKFWGEGEEEVITVPNPLLEQEDAEESKGA